ncbi:MAG: class I SAM-dependent methyltransferase [Mycobacterium sp.]
MSALFGGTGWYYARYRPGYPQAFIDDIARHFHLDGTGRLLDLGCGTGQLTLPLAPYVAVAVGMDPEPEMLAEAAGQAQAMGITNVTWARGSSSDLSSTLGQFRVVTMGRSFHWMDREQVLASLDQLIDDGGGIVLANDSCLVRPITGWQRSIEELQHRFLPSDFTFPEPLASRMSAAAEPLSHEEVLARSPFPQVQRRVYESTRRWTVEQIVGYLYSTSVPLRRLLGDRRGAFEAALTDALLAIEPAGRFDEPVTLEVLMATRE